MERELGYTMAPPTPEEKERDSNLDRMNRWERAQGMKMKDLTDNEWVEVASRILALTQSEAWDYLHYMRTRMV